MTVTADQAKMLTALGLAVRPYAAPRFDGAGVHAQIGKVARMSLHEVSLVVLAVCADPTLGTPANIGDTKSRHWQGVHVVRAEPPARDVAPIGSRCTVCGLPEVACRLRWAPTGNIGRDEHQGRHEFTRPRERNVDVTPVIHELKDIAAGPKVAP